MHIQWYLMGRVSLVNQVVGVQGQGGQRHDKDLKFGGRSFMNIVKSSYPQFSLCHLMTLYMLLISTVT